MKKFRFFFFLATVLAISTVFYNCGGSEDPIVNLPTIKFTAPLPITVTSFKVDRYQDITFKFTGAQNAVSKKTLSKVKMEVKYSGAGTETLLDSTVNAASISVVKTYSVKGDAPWNQVITITFSIEDKDAKIVTKVYTLTLDPSISDIIEGEVSMGAQSDTMGSYFAADQIQVLKAAPAKLIANQPRIDFVFLNDEVGSNGDCIAAPSDPIVADQSINLCGNFTTKNATQFKQLAYDGDTVYYKIRSKAALQSLFENGTGVGVGVIKSLTDGDGGTEPTVMAFKTVGTIVQFGLIRVKKITYGTTGPKNEVLISVKVSKKI